MKKGALISFTKFTGKHLCQSLYFNKVAGLWAEACNFIKKETLAQVFPCGFCDISKNTLFTEHLWTTTSDFICGVFFMFSIIRNFCLEKSRLVENRLYPEYSGSVF